MAVYDRWHKDPAEGDKPCRCGTGRHKLYPSAAHGKGDRWQVRWDDPNSAGRKQLKRNFGLLRPEPGELPDRNRHASAFDKEIQGSIVRQDYADPNAGNVTLEEYAETWKTTTGHEGRTAEIVESLFRSHVYQDPANPGRSRRGALAIGHHTMALLAQRPTVCAAWLASLKGPLPAERSRRAALKYMSALCDAAVEDGVMRRNPFRSTVIDRPGNSGERAEPYSAAELAGIRAGLPARYEVLADLGAGLGAREMELAALSVGDFRFLGRRPRVTVERQLKMVGGKMVAAPLKNNKPHDVPLAPALAARVARHLELFPAAEVKLPWHDPGSRRHGETITLRLVLTREDRTPVRRGTVQNTWRTAVGRYLAAREPGRKRREPHRGWNLHRLRHTYASAQLRAGTDIVRVAAWMGDTVQEVMATYAHLMPGDEDGEAQGRAAVDGLFADLRAPGAPPQEDEGTSGQASG